MSEKTTTPADRPAGERQRSRLRKAPGSTAVLGVLAGAAIAVAATALVAAGSLAAPPAAPSFPAPSAAVPAGRSVGVCPQPARLLEGSVSGTDPQFSPDSTTASSALSALVLSNDTGVLPGSRITRMGAGSPAATLASPPAAGAAPAAGPPSQKAAVVRSLPASGTMMLTADQQDGEQPAAAALMRYSATDGDLRGLAAAGCQQPSNDLWLVGASTTVGRTAILNITNASPTPATVNLDLFGDKGVVEAAGSRGLLVSPGSTRSIVLAGLAANQQKLAVRLKSSGGPVTATIQQSVLRGLAPGGVEFIEPAAQPALSQVLSGLDLQAPATADALRGKDGFADAAAALQVAVPGASDAVVEVRLYGQNGQQPLPGGGVFRAPAGAVSELPLTGVPAGTYTVAVKSDTAITAAARVVRGTKSDASVDFAVSANGVRLGAQHLVPVPQGLDSRLVFGAPDGQSKISLVPVASNGSLGDARTLNLQAGTTAVVDTAAAGGKDVAGFIVSASGAAAYGAQVLTGGGQQGISVLGLPPAATGQSSIPVTVGF
ncbi:hypothetical protein KIH31_07380 [Paenarthrobacter sp. DKR-5]|uniref:DUF5719 family protein n=1 Tax=Paenarthrobacter sp. DKR-5 TaxID=2835535 RepID=UPI001BDCDD29|nr:DUF5719 family protein [Paenarthrobacter sp. DKR-5]MBT1002422.1 hypothetical protein [Paenarthrobacter sp. DKR-5]